MIRRPKLVAVWAAIYAVVTVATVLLLRPFTLAMADMQRQAALAATTRVANATPPAVASLPGSFWVLFATIYVLLLVALVVAFAAVVRAVTEPERSRFAYLRLGMDELRLVGLGLLLVVLGIVAEVVVSIVVVLIVGALTVAGGQVAAAIAGVIAVFVFIGLVIWAQVRLSLAGALTVMRKRIVVREAWRVTRGSFWSLFAVYLVIGAIAGAVTMVLAAAFNPRIVGAYLSMNPQNMMAAVQDRMAQQSDGMSPLIIVQSIVGAVVNTALGTAVFAAIATAAQQAIHQEQPAAEFA